MEVNEKKNPAWIKKVSRLINKKKEKSEEISPSKSNERRINRT
jgi:hypothetical protein